jgi:peptidoglycan/LPS O-acetylase OafA/YrhL
MRAGFDDPMAGLEDRWSYSRWAAYTSFGRVLFVLALAGISVLNCSGNGGFVYGFLTLPFWEPMGKLTYGAYLIHPTVLRVYFYQLTQLYQVRSWWMRWSW